MERTIICISRQYGSGGHKGVDFASALYSSFFITTLRFYEWPSCSEPSCVK